MINLSSIILAEKSDIYGSIYKQVINLRHMSRFLSQAVLE